MKKSHEHVYWLSLKSLYKFQFQYKQTMDNLHTRFFTYSKRPKISR